MNLRVSRSQLSNYKKAYTDHQIFQIDMVKSESLIHKKGFAVLFLLTPSGGRDKQVSGSMYDKLSVQGK